MTIGLVVAYVSGFGLKHLVAVVDLLPDNLKTQFVYNQM